MLNHLQRSIARGVLPLAIITLSLLWFASLAANVAFNQHSKDGWQQTPLFVMFLMAGIPLLLALLVPWVFRGFAVERRRPGAWDFLILFIGAVPPVLVAAWLCRVLVWH